MGNCSSPLRQAIRFHDHIEAKRILEDAGDGASDLINEDQSADCCFDILFCNVRAQSPVFTVVAQGDVAMMRMLIQYGADLDTRGVTFDETAMHIAAKTNNIAMVTLIHEYAPHLINVTDCRDRLPLHWCVNLPARANTEDRKETTSYVLSNMDTSLINAKDESQKSPLDYAMQNKHFEIISLLKQS